MTPELRGYVRHIGAQNGPNVSSYASRVPSAELIRSNDTPYADGVYMIAIRLELVCDTIRELYSGRIILLSPL